MDVRKEDFPVVLQAYEILNSKELFIAEQVVNSQTEVDAFTNRFAGKVIKAKQWSNKDKDNATVVKRSGTSAGTIILIIVIILIILVFLNHLLQGLQLLLLLY